MKHSKLGESQNQKCVQTFYSVLQRLFVVENMNSCKEAGKPWNEADADTAEAIDFMEYYGRQMLKLKDGIPVESRPIEYNRFSYIPLGVGVIISPWNFPFAIMAGMTTAALVSGNTVLLKPASTTPVVAAKFMEVLEEAGLPAGVVNFVPGNGSEVGDYLVDHPRTRSLASLDLVM